MNINDTIKWTNLAWIYAKNFFLRSKLLECLHFLKSQKFKCFAILYANISWCQKKIFSISRNFCNLNRNATNIDKVAQTSLYYKRKLLANSKHSFHFKLFVVCLCFTWVECVKMSVVRNIYIMVRHLCCNLLKYKRFYHVKIISLSTIALYIRNAQKYITYQ